MEMWYPWKAMSLRVLIKRKLIKKFSCVTNRGIIFEIDSFFKMFEFCIVASAYVFSLNFSSHRMWADEGSTVAGNTFVGTIDEENGTIFE